jgi:hypothetical protein
MKTDTLFNLINKFDDKEKKALHNYLAAFNGTFGEHHQTKLSRLFELLTEGVTDNTDIENELEVTGDAFRKLKDRLKDKAFNSLLLDVNIKRSNAFPTSFKSFIDAKQDYIKARLALSKGLDNEAWQFINKGILKAKKFEVYADLLELLYLKQRFVNLRKGKAAFDKVETEIEHFEICRTAYNKAARFAELLHQKVGFNNSKQENSRFLKSCITELKKDYKATNSPFVNQKLLLFNMQYYEEQDNFKKCAETAYATADFLKTNKRLSNNTQIGAAYLNAARYHIILQEYNKALQCTELCVSYFTANSYAHSYTQELIFHTYFYQENFTSALNTINHLLKNEHFKDWSYQTEKWQYLLACTYFKLEDYKAANKILAKQFPELEKDMEGWATYLIILRIMTQIERKQFDLADASIDQLQYFLKSKQPKARLKAIALVLNNLKNEGYNFSKIKLDKQLMRLSSNKGWHTKQNMEAEIVWFDVWVNKK